MEWTPERIRLLRQTGLCLSQHDFAKALGFDKRTIGNAERGAHPPGLALRRALDHALAQATDTQRTRFHTALTQDHAPVIPGATPVVESVELLRRIEASDLGPATLDQLHQLIDQLGTEYFTVPPAQFRNTVVSWRRYVTRLLAGTLTLHERRELYRVAGWLSGLLAEVSLALGEQAETHCTTALALAHETGDSRLAGWVHGTQAQIALYTGNPHHAITHAHTGTHTAPTGSTARFRSCALATRAHARQGDRRAAEHALSQAEQALETRTELQTGNFFSFDAPYLPYYAGTAYVWLGEAARARIWASQAIELCDADPEPWPVARTNARVDLAIALTQDGQRDGAAMIGAEAMDIWAKRPTYPARKRINELMTALQPFAEPYVAELKERWQSIYAAAGAGDPKHLERFTE